MAIETFPTGKPISYRVTGKTELPKTVVRRRTDEGRETEYRYVGGERKYVRKGGKWVKYTEPSGYEVVTEREGGLTTKRVKLPPAYAEARSITIPPWPTWWYNRGYGGEIVQYTAGTKGALLGADIGIQSAKRETPKTIVGMRTGADLGTKKLGGEVTLKYSTMYPEFKTSMIEGVGIRGREGVAEMLKGEGIREYEREQIEARSRMGVRGRETAGGVAQEKYLIYSPTPILIPSMVGISYEPEKRTRYGTLTGVELLSEEERRGRYLSFASKDITPEKSRYARAMEEYEEARYKAESPEAYSARFWDVGVGALEIGGGLGVAAKGVSMTLPEVVQTVGAWGTAGVVGKKAGIEIYKATGSEMLAAGVDIGLTLGGGYGLTRGTTPLVRKFEKPKFKPMDQGTRLVGEEISYSAKDITEAEHKFFTITKTPGGRTLYKGKASTVMRGKLDVDVVSKVSMKKLAEERGRGPLGWYRAWVHRLPKEPKYTTGYEMKLVGETKPTQFKGVSVSKYTGYTEGRVLAKKMKPLDFKGVQDIKAMHVTGKTETITRGVSRGSLVEREGSIFKPKITGRTGFTVSTRPGALSPYGRAGGRITTKLDLTVKPSKAGISLGERVPKKIKWTPYEIKAKQLQAEMLRTRMATQEMAVPSYTAMERLTPLSGVGMAPGLRMEYPRLDIMPAQKQITRRGLKTKPEQLTRIKQEPLTLTRTGTQEMMQLPTTRTRTGLMPSLKQPKIEFTVGELTTKPMQEQATMRRGMLNLPDLARPPGGLMAPPVGGGHIDFIPPAGGLLLPRGGSKTLKMPKGYYGFGKRRKARVLKLTEAGVDKVLKGLIPYSRRIKKAR